jgi:transcriptional regulator with XRE-family HTH domain
MSVAVTPLRLLGAEPFGQQLRRARKESGIQLREAAERVSRFMLTTHTTLNRLEHFAEPPTIRSQRAVAYLAMVCYGFDPTQIGLSHDDVPSGIAERMADVGGSLRSRCFTVRCVQLALA